MKLSHSKLVMDVYVNDLLVGVPLDTVLGEDGCDELVYLGTQIEYNPGSTKKNTMLLHQGRYTYKLMDKFAEHFTSNNLKRPNLFNTTVCTRHCALAPEGRHDSNEGLVSRLGLSRSNGNEVLLIVQGQHEPT
eukprot:3387958-Amphidinium_carterae.1